MRTNIKKKTKKNNTKHQKTKKKNKKQKKTTHPKPNTESTKNLSSDQKLGNDDGDDSSETLLSNPPTLSIHQISNRSHIRNVCSFSVSGIEESL
jgi:hypothetical protein